MKLFGKADLTVTDFGTVNTHIEKEDEYKTEFSCRTSGFIKYLNLPKGTKVRVTIEVIEDGDSSQ